MSYRRAWREVAAPLPESLPSPTNITVTVMRSFVIHMLSTGTIDLWEMCNAMQCNAVQVDWLIDWFMDGPIDCFERTVAAHGKPGSARLHTRSCGGKEPRMRRRRLGIAALCDRKCRCAGGNEEVLGSLIIRRRLGWRFMFLQIIKRWMIDNFCSPSSFSVSQLCFMFLFLFILFIK